jgi:hypothetical protein
MMVIAAVGQLYGWLIFIRTIREQMHEIKKMISRFARILFLFSVIAFSIKLCLQAGSVIPSLSKLAFGFRPIVIGYLHLVLLGVITMFIMALILSEKLINMNRSSRFGIIIFVLGIFFNEGLLMIQGIEDFRSEGVPNINQLLLLAACMLFTGLILMVSGQFFRKDDQNHNSSGIPETVL